MTYLNGMILYRFSIFSNFLIKKKIRLANKKTRRKTEEIIPRHLVLSTLMYGDTPS